MAYRRIFDPDLTVTFVDPAANDSSPLQSADRRDGSVYVYNDAIIRGVNVTLATGRPLLIRGPSGSGKSSLASNVARVQGWRYYEDVISSRTQARDLLWRFDYVRRLNDAQARQLKADDAAYVEPGVLWWAIDRAGARNRGRPAGQLPPAVEPGTGIGDERAVVLLDEIDKAEPDVPNNLLVPLGSLEFYVPEIGVPVTAIQSPVIFITTNDERELPTAFLRRCVILELAAPDEESLVRIANAHYGPADERLYRAIARRVVEFGRSQADDEPVPSIAEFLDTVRACRRLEIVPDPSNADWEALLVATVRKQRAPGRGA